MTTTPTPDTPAPQRVSDERLAQLIDELSSESGEYNYIYRYLLDLRDSRASEARLRAALADKTAELDREYEESEHYAALAFVDQGANPPVTWKERAAELARQLAERETVTEEMVERAWVKFAELDDGGGVYRGHMKPIIEAALQPAQGGEAPKPVAEELVGPIEDDMLIQLLRKGEAPPASQNDAANWLCRLYGQPQHDDDARTTPTSAAEPAGEDA